MVAECAAIVLAAGASSRLGQPKQLVRTDGETLLRRTTRLAGEAGCSPVIVVLGWNGELFVRELDGLTAQTVINPNWQQGMASSLKCGLECVSGSANVMVLVCDQPNLNALLLQKLLSTHSERQLPITASAYGEALGVPAVFSSSLLSELQALTGDQGARKIIARYAGRAAAVPFPEGEFDIDTPADLARLG